MKVTWLFEIERLIVICGEIILSSCKLYIFVERKEYVFCVCFMPCYYLILYIPSFLYCMHMVFISIMVCSLGPYICIYRDFLVWFTVLL